jgi:hypothetical protein
MDINTANDIPNGNDNKTYFAPAERDSIDEIRKQSETSLQDPIIKVVLQSVEGFVLILNRHRQVLAGNKELLETLEIKDDSYLGYRPGELFSCMHSTESPGGCGTSNHCKVCGAVIAILASLSTNESVIEECSMMMHKNNKIECHEFKVHVTPITISGYSLLIFVLQDVSSVKRREVLEQVFFHDITNIIQCLIGWSEMIKIGNPKEAADKIVKLSEYLQEEITNQYTLRAAETGDLKIKKSRTESAYILDVLSSFFADHALTSDRRLAIIPPADGISFSTDASLLMRVLINMVKNALEASSIDGLVHVICEKKSRQIVFSVHNDGVISDEVALNIFTRYFSTKTGSGRGLGTYSMKLYGEQYLGGSVTYSSTENDGTTFYISLPE